MFQETGAYVLFNEREQLLDWVIDQLETRGIRIEYWSGQETSPGKGDAEKGTDGNTPKADARMVSFVPRHK